MADPLPLTTPTPPPPPPPAPPLEPTGAVSLSARAIADGLALLIPAATAVMQYLKQERSYEVIFLAAAFAGLYFYLRGQQGIIAQQRQRELVLEAKVDRQRYDMNQMDEKCEREMNTMREKHDAEVAALETRYRRMIGTVETSLINAFSDLTVFADRRRIGHFSRDPLDNMLVYERAPVLLPPSVPEDRRGTGDTILPGITR